VEPVTIKKDAGRILKMGSQIQTTLPFKAMPFLDLNTRKQENNDVIKFQKTRDQALLEKIYLNRIPTLKVWSNRFYYLAETKESEDLFSELSQVFIKTLDGYKHKRKIKINGKTISKKTPFNTYLYYSLDNYIKNLRNSKNAKKRTPLDEEGNSIPQHFVLSLNYGYDGKNNVDGTLMDVIEKSLSVENNILKNMSFEEMLCILSESNPQFKETLRKIAHGHTINALIKDCNKENGFVLSGMKNVGKRMVKKIIRKNNGISESFNLLDYTVKNNGIAYVIQYKTKNRVNNILKMLRYFKKNKHHLMKKINA